MVDGIAYLALICESYGSEEEVWTLSFTYDTGARWLLAVNTYLNTKRKGILENKR
jgi:hypothetical protein